jgi:zona occludens toxin
MSIVAYTGWPGSGKTYTVVEHVILPALEKGRRICTNIELNIDDPRIAKFDVKDIQENPDAVNTVFQPGDVVVIDEAWRLWPSGLKASAIEETHKSLFAEHRHRVGEDGNSMEIVLVVQDLSMMAAFTRNLVDETFRSTKLSAIGLKKGYRIDIYQGGVTGQKPPKSQLIRQINGKYKESIYKLYKSHTQSMTGEAGKEQKLDTRGNVFNTWLIKGGVPLAVFMVIWGITKVYAAFQPEEEQEPKVEFAKMAPQNVVKRPETKVTKTPKKIIRDDGYSRTWRLLGVITWDKNGKQEGIATIKCNTGSRRIELDRCKEIITGEWVCEYEGLKVAKWTGYINDMTQVADEGVKNSTVSP